MILKWLPVNELYLAAGKNDLYFRQGRASTNDMADQTRLLFQNDTSLMGYFNRTFANGKWNHFMDQSHLGYTSWADPPFNSLRAINLKQVEAPDKPLMGISVEGSEAVWPGGKGDPVLPEFDIFNHQSHYIDIFNKGKTPFEFSALSDHPWIILMKTKGPFGKDERLWISIDWNKVPKGRTSSTVKVTGTGNVISVRVNVPAATPGKDSPCLEYQMYLFRTGTGKRLYGIMPVSVKQLILFHNQVIIHLRYGWLTLV